MGHHGRHPQPARREAADDQHRGVELERLVADDRAIDAYPRRELPRIDHAESPWLTRDGSWSLRELGYDKALTEASTQIVDAQDRLEYVASLTEQAANKVLNTLDEGMPAQDVLSKKAKEMDSRWAALFAGKLSIDEFKALAGDSRSFAQAVTEAVKQVLSQQ